MVGNGRKSALIVLATLTVFSGAYLAWQLLGLRYTNHDDIYFALNASSFFGDYFGFAKIVAVKQARLQAFINMPVELWALHFGDSFKFDVANIGAFALLYLSLIWFLQKIGDFAGSLAVVVATLLLFPLHYYFTFPQGYPVVDSWQILFALTAAALLHSYLDRPCTWKLLLSAGLFTVSLWGAEYNVVLHPALLIVVMFSQKKLNITYIRKTVAPYLIGFILTGVSYAAFSLASRHDGANADSRVTLGFNLVAWLKTFFIFHEKSSLLFGLWHGIDVTSATAQGAPLVPSTLTFFDLWHGISDWASIAVVFVVMFAIFSTIFALQNISKKIFRNYLLFFLCIAVIPTLVVSVSSLYQMIITKGYLQGHLVTFYNQLGISAILFLLFSAACNLPRTSVRRALVVVLSAIAFAGLATVTFVYNNVNRQIMSANRQKWEAVRVLAGFSYSQDSTLAGTEIYAPDLWSESGVSGTPSAALLGNENYWTEYTRTVLGKELHVSNVKNGTNYNAEVRYFATPTGVPVLLVGEKIGADGQWRNQLVASRAVMGDIFSAVHDDTSYPVLTEDWHCAAYCVLPLGAELSTEPSMLRFSPSDRGPTRLLEQFWLSRNGSFAFPLIDRTEFDRQHSLDAVKIVGWGPQAVTRGEVPNPQPDGSAGIWIRFDGELSSDAVKVFVDGQPAISTSVGKGLITASLAANRFGTPGERLVALKDTRTGVTIVVGKIEVNP